MNWLQKLKFNWKRVINAGVSPDQDFSNKKKIRLVNIAVVLTLPIIISKIIVNVTSGELTKVISLLALIISFIVVYLLNKIKTDRLAVLFLFVSTSIYIYFMPKHRSKFYSFYFYSAFNSNLLLV